MWVELRQHRGYLVNELGEVACILKGKWVLKAQRIDKHGYATVRLFRRPYLVHRLVKRAFHGPSALQVDHINGIKHDNRLENLDYVTPKENMRRFHALRAAKMRRISAWIFKTFVLYNLR